MIPALIILTLWVALLAPGVVKWLRNHQRTSSIASFHRQLRKLEHSGPKLVEPAYRLGGQDGPPSEREPLAALVRAPRLVLVPTGASEKEQPMRYEDNDDEGYQRYVDPFGQPSDDPRAMEAGWDDPWPDADRRDAPTRAHRAVRTARYDAYHDVDRRDRDDHDDAVVLSPTRARARRSRILWGLAGAIGGSILLGLVSGFAVLYAVTLVSVVALLCYLVLMYYASSVGLYGNDALASITPVARSVVPVHTERSYRFDDDEGRESERVAAAR